MTQKNNMKMADFISGDHRLIAVLYRLGIGLGFGERTVEEICRASGINSDTFMLIANIYTVEHYIPTQEILDAADMMDIVKYLHASHSYYLDIEFPDLEKELEELISPCNPAQKAVISKFFADYKKEVENHFAYEEDIVFPYVKSIINGRRIAGYSIDKFEEHHDNIQEKVDDLRNIIMKYLPKECDSVVALRILGHLCSLNEDLEKHTYIENKVLIPLVDTNENTFSIKDTAFSQNIEILSLREQEILVCVAKGMLNKEIADKLCLSVHTIITHRKNITHKTGIKTVAGLTVYALLNNLIDPSQL